MLKHEKMFPRSEQKTSKIVLFIYLYILYKVFNRMCRVSLFQPFCVHVCTYVLVQMLSMQVFSKSLLYSFSGKSDHLKDMLSNNHLRAMLNEINSSNEAGRHLESAMQIPIFTEFVDECMKVVDPTELPKTWRTN